MMLASAAILLSFISSTDTRGSATATTPELRGLPLIQRCQSSEKVELGEKLFRDARLSADGRVSCATCHQPERAFTDGKSLAQGIGGRLGTRNTPSLANAALHETFSWEGRRASLEEQVADAFVHSREHGLPSHDALLAIVRNDAIYRSAFDTAFPKSSRADAISLAHVKEAIACFVRTLASGNSAFDRYMYGGDRTALNDHQKRGLQLFRGKGQCVECHTIETRQASFTDNQFHRVQLASALLARLPLLLPKVLTTSKDELSNLTLSSAEIAAMGRFVVTGEAADLGRFRTPSLRNVALTAPYMHDGSETTLRGAVEREAYYRGAELGRPLNLTPSERDDLVAFLESLTSGRYASLTRGLASDPDSIP